MMTVSYGHGISVTAMQLVSAVASIMNGGHLVKPTLIKQDTPPAPTPPIIAASTVRDMHTLMRVVVTEGTGKSANVAGYMVGGKTGTADKPNVGGYNRNARLSSFISAFPINDPRYVVFVMIDEPKGTKDTYGFATAGYTAAPVVGKVIEQMAPLLHIAPLDEEAITNQQHLRPPQAVSGEAM